MPEKAIKIIGGNKLDGSLFISGAKNAALPLMSAALLADTGSNKLSNIPYLADIQMMSNLLIELGADISLNVLNNEEKQRPIRTLEVNNRGGKVGNTIVDGELVNKIRASILLIAPMLKFNKKVKIALPGGCAIGKRPINIHLQGLLKMGVEVDLYDDHIEATAANGLIGSEMELDFPSVGASENLIMAATFAKGKTIIKNLAQEPEVVDLVKFLTCMGAKIAYLDNCTVEIIGGEELKGCDHYIVNDRIEASSYAVLAAATDGKIKMLDTSMSIFHDTIEIFNKIGVKIEELPNGEGVMASRAENFLQLNKNGGVEINTTPFPGFPTDIQAQIMALCAITPGRHVITENVWENRFMHAEYLNKMGAKIEISGNRAVIEGVSHLNPCTNLEATDLRASFSLIIAALSSPNNTSPSFIHKIHHLDRGYEAVEMKISRCGGNIDRVRV